jgi:hypothetical protein
VRRWLARPEAALFALVFGAYAYFYQAGGWNQNTHFALTRALVEDRSLAIDRVRGATGDLAKKDGHFFCDKAPGLSLAGAIPYTVETALLGVPRSRAGLGWASWLATVFAVALPSACGVVALALLLGALGLRAGPSALVAAAWGLATLALPYATLFYSHQVAASLLVTSFAIAVRIARGIDPPSRARLFAIGAIGGWAIAVEYQSALAAIPIGVYLARRLGLRPMLWIVLGGVGPALVLVWYHTVAFGAPWHLPYDYSTQGNRSQGFFMGIGVPHARALWGITFSPYRGLFFSAPWLLLAIPGGVLLARRGARDEAIVCGVVALLFVWMNASLVDWDGGWAVGPRYLVPCIPFLVVLAGGWLAPPIARAPRVAWIAGALVAAYAAFLMLAATAVQPEVDGRIKHPWGDYVLAQLEHGNLATSDQAIDMAGRDGHGARYAWNLGEQLGLGGLASLAPLVLWCGAWSWFLARRTRATQ